MNEQIKKLVNDFAENIKANTGYDMTNYDPFLNEADKFAQLVAQECMDMAKNYTTRPYEMGMNEKTRTAWNIYMDIADRFEAYNEQQI